jgi:hypothetical protein
VRPAQFEQVIALKVSVVRRQAGPVVPRLPELPIETSFGLAQGPLVAPAEPALAVLPALPPAPATLAPA